MVGGYPWDAGKENKEEDSMSVSDISKIPGGGAGKPPPTVIDVPMSGQRSLATVTAEIRTIRAARDKMFLAASVEIGRRLKEAKELVGHGGWGDYCKTELDFSQQTAQNHIRLFEAYAADQIRLDGAALKSQTLGDLSYTQALELLALPSEEAREAFVAEHDMASLSTRELHAEIARLREEKEAAEADAREINAQKRQAEARAEEADKQCLSLRDALAVMQKERKADEEQWKTQAAEACAARDEAEQEAAQAKEALYSAEAAKKTAEAARKEAEREKAKLEKEAKAAKKELDEARKNPQVPQEVLDRLKREAEETARKAAEAEQAAAVQAAKEEMASDARRYKEELEAAQKALKLAAPEMAAFRVRFEAAQEALDKAVDALWDLPSDKVDGGVRALRAILEQAGKRLEEERYEAAMPE